MILVSLGSGYGPDGWWKFLPSTVAILLVSRIFYRRDWRERLGFVGSGKLWLVSLVLLPVIYWAGFYCVQAALSESEYMVVKGSFADWFTNLPQTLNEELVFRGLLLTGLSSVGLKRWPSIVGPALVFVFFHWFFYQYNMKLPNRGDLEWTAMATLLFFGGCITRLRPTLLLSSIDARQCPIYGCTPDRQHVIYTAAPPPSSWAFHANLTDLFVG